MRAALTIAGSDPGGGAGIQADLKTFAAFGVYGVSAITAVTAQNTMGVDAIAPLAADFVTAQIETIAGDIGVHATKDGRLATGGRGEGGPRAAAGRRRSRARVVERRTPARRRRRAGAPHGAAAARARGDAEHPGS